MSLNTCQILSFFFLLLAAPQVREQIETVLKSPFLSSGWNNQCLAGQDSARAACGQMIATARKKINCTWRPNTDFWCISAHHKCVRCPKHFFFHHHHLLIMLFVYYNNYAVCKGDNFDFQDHQTPSAPLPRVWLCCPGNAANTATRFMSFPSRLRAFLAQNWRDNRSRWFAAIRLNTNAGSSPVGC